jgi:UDP-glucose 4-epimerase
MKLLVTGSAGHLGEALVRTFRERGDEVVALDCVRSPFTNRVGDITNRTFIRDCVSGVNAVFHTATLHKPHIKTHSRQDFVDTNITGTLNLLEEAVMAQVDAFLYTSTTSVFGDALTPAEGAPAAWITEDVVPVPKNIYGTTKAAAEDLCQLFHRNHKLPTVVLRTSRFFPEWDDSRHIREAYSDANVKTNEFLYRRADIEDVVAAHLLALQKAPDLGFRKYIISATTPFLPEDVRELRVDAPAVVRRRVPEYEREYSRRQWKMFPSISRVYMNAKARRELGWNPRHDFGSLIARMASGVDDLRSSLAQVIGIKGYHGARYADGLYPVE